MRRPVLLGVVAAACVAPSAARAAEVTTGSGIAVIELSKDESRAVFGAADSAAAFAQVVAGALPAEYQAAVRLAAGGWQAVRLVVPASVPVRLVVTALPPAVLLLPAGRATAADVIATYTRLREKAADRAKALLAPALEARVPLDQLGRWVEARLSRETAAKGTASRP